MTKSISNNWLEPFRKKENFTQLALATEIKVDKRTIGLWEHYERNNVHFEDLAKALKVSVEALQDAYQKGLYGHIIQLLKKKPIDKQLITKTLKDCNAMGLTANILQLMEFNNEEEAASKIKDWIQKGDILSLLKKKPINTKLIIKALNDCKAMGLTANIMQKMEVNNEEEAASKIEDWIKKGDILPFRKTFNQSISNAVSKVTVGQEADLNIIEQLIAAIALSATITHNQKEMAETPIFHIQGVEKAWSIRLLVDASYGNQSITGISAISPTTLEVRGAVEIEETTEDELWSQVHQVVGTLFAELFMSQEPYPELDDQADHPHYRKFCQEVINEQVENTNEEDVHCFLFSLQDEPRDVRNLIGELIESLRIYICCNNNQSIPILHLQELKLESFIAGNLLKTQQRREQLKQDKSTTGAIMSEKTRNKTESKVEVNTTGNVSFSMDNASAIQHNHNADNQKLGELLEQILATTDNKNAEHRQLRGDVKEIQSVLKKTGKPPEEGNSWLKEIRNKLTADGSVDKGSKLIKLLSDLIGLYDKVPMG